MMNKFGSPANLKPFPFHLPYTGPLSSPFVRSYLRKQILSIRRNYKRTYLSCNMIMRDGFLSWYAVHSVVLRSGINLRLFSVLSLIVCCTEQGKVPIALDAIYKYFAGVYKKWVLTKIIKRLEKINFIKIYRYNPRNPSGPCKHLVLLPAAVRFYKSFVDVLRSHVLSAVEDPDYPSVTRKTVPGSHILRL